MTQTTNQNTPAETIEAWYERVTKEAIMLGHTLPTLSRTEPQEKIEILGNMRKLSQDIIQKQRIGSVALTEFADALALYYLQEVLTVTSFENENEALKNKRICEFREASKFETFLAVHGRRYDYTLV